MGEALAGPHRVHNSSDSSDTWRRLDNEFSILSVLAWCCNARCWSLAEEAQINCGFKANPTGTVGGLRHFQPILSVNEHAWGGTRTLGNLQLLVLARVLSALRHSLGLVRMSHGTKAARSHNSMSNFTDCSVCANAQEYRERSSSLSESPSLHKPPYR